MAWLSLSLSSPLVFFHASTLPPLAHHSLFFLAHPFIKRWLPYLICILLISCCQLTPVIPFHFIPYLFHPLSPSLTHSLTLSAALCPSHLPQLPSDHSASMNLWPTWSNCTLWLTELQYSKWGFSTLNEDTGPMPCPSQSQLAAMLSPAVPSH